MNHSRGLIAAAVIGAMAVAGCGDTETTETAAPSETSATPAPAAESTTSTPELSDGVLTVEAVDYAFKNLPEAVPEGTEIKLTNTAKEEIHEMVAFKLPDDETRSADEIVAGADPAGPPPGEFQGVLVAEPGEDGFAPTGPMVLTEPGRYLFLCSVPTGADPAEVIKIGQEGGQASEAEGGPPHLVHGMYGAVTVE